MIYTVTINPSIDYLLTVDSFQLGETNRASGQSMVPGGKGINVSRVLHRFGLESEAMGFTAGFTGEFLKQELRHEGINGRFIDTEGRTRINVKLKTEQETEINGRSPEIKGHHISTLLNQLDSLEEGGTLVLSGSLPSFLPADLYKSIIERVKAKGVFVYVDTSGESLKESLQAAPFLIKPNQNELASLYKEDIHDLKSAVNAGKKAVADGAEHVLVSMAGNGAALVSESLTLAANVPKGTVRNSVGAGDSMVAGFIYAYEQSGSMEEAFRFSVAAGSATAFSTGFCSKDHVLSLLPDVYIKRL